MKKTYIKPEITREELKSLLLETNEKLYEANEKLKREEKERTELIANLSHDLRASLSVISGAVELLKTEAEDGSESKEILELVAKRAGFMQRLVEDLFFLAKLESRGGQVPLAKVDLRIFLEDYFWSVKADGRFGGRTLRLEIPEDFSGYAKMDPELILRVLDNLFSNARKYSGEEAEIVLSAEDAGKEFHVCVSDNGNGISSEDLPHIFERTYRSSRARTPEEGSSGLGLAIVKSIMERCGGSVSCESEEGKGSTFRLTLQKA